MKQPTISKTLIRLFSEVHGSIISKLWGEAVDRAKVNEMHF